MEADTALATAYALLGLVFLSGTVWLAVAMVRRRSAKAPAGLASATAAVALVVLGLAGTPFGGDDGDPTVEVTPPSMPFGWIKDPDFGDQVTLDSDTDASRYSLEFFGGKLVDGGYDPRVYILSTAAPDGVELAAIVDEHVRQITSTDPDQRIVVRERVELSGEPAEWVELIDSKSLNRKTVRTSQLHVVKDRRHWILQCVGIEGNAPIEVMKPNLPRFEMVRCKESLFTVRLR